MTFAQIAIEQCTEAREIRYGDRVKVLWHNGAARECKVVMRDMSAVVDAMVARLDSELHDEDLLLQLACFDLGEWSDIKGLLLDGAAEAQHRSLLLTNRYDKISRALRLDVPESRRQFKAAVRCCVRERRRMLHIQPSDTVDNRSVWCHIFTPDCDEQDFGVVRLAVRFYISMSDGTVSVERGLGQVLSVLQEHSGSLAEDGSTTWDLVEVNIDGPKSESELFTQSTDDGPLLLTAVSRRCAKLWLEQHGRRFLVQRRRRRDHGTSGKKQARITFRHPGC